MGKLKDGAKLPDALEVKVIEQPLNTIYLVLPTSSSEELSDEALSTVVGGIGLRVCF